MRKSMSTARVPASDPNSLVAVGIHGGPGQRASLAAGLTIPIQDVCQCGAVNKVIEIQTDKHFALHQMDAGSCLFKRHQLK
jgi:hypothetical protein